MRPLQTVLCSTSFPRARTRLGPFVWVSSRLSLKVDLNFNFWEQRSTSVFSVLFHARNLSDWHRSSVHRSHFHREARVISIYQGNDEKHAFIRNLCMLRIVLNSIHKVCSILVFHEDDLALICNQLQSGCNARRLSNHGKFRTRAPIFTTRKNSHSTFARLGMLRGAYSCRIRMLKWNSCRNCGYFCTLPLGENQ